MAGFRALSPNININTTSGQLRTELLNTFARLDGTLQLAPYRLVTDVGPLGNSAGVESTIFDYTVSTGTLAKSGSSILITAAGSSAANANNKTLRLYFGGTEIFSTGAQAFNNADWILKAEIVRIGASSQFCWVEFTASNTLTQSIKTTNTTLSFASNQLLKITGEGTAAQDIYGDYWKAILLA